MPELKPEDILLSDWYEMNPKVPTPYTPPPRCIICGAEFTACEDFLTGLPHEEPEPQEQEEETWLREISAPSVEWQSDLTDFLPKSM